MHRDDSHDYVPLVYGTGVVLFCAIAVLINRRPIGDIILMIVGGLAVLITAGYYIAQYRTRGRREAEAEQSQQWTSYSRADGNDWVVGIERRGHFLQLENREMYRFPDSTVNVPDRLDAEGDAIARAADFNGRRTP